ncbi:MAG: squalene/phytoene synthase family protein [Nitrospiraceae bacterium]|nr:squalene/phytoene synthase family protein [Nitrospiraceae bacterium]
MKAAANGPPAEDVAYQNAILQEVSRTFALTIPLLPPRLHVVVGTAYLLCRIADTIEDSDTIGAEEKRRFGEMFLATLEGRADPDAFASELAPRLHGTTLEAEKDLVRNTVRVVRLTHSYSPEEQAAMTRCVRIMSEGMSRYQQGAFSHGVPDMAHMEDYCYHVAGVVGEMLTDLFCAHSPAVAVHRDHLYELSPAFGRGLQMTNILKDIWDDKERDACWLPRDVFERHGFDLDRLGLDNPKSPAFESALGELIGEAWSCLDDAMTYATLLPKSEPGIRRFCFFPVGLAVLTLQRLNAHRDFNSGDQVKITRASVKKTALVTMLFGRSNRLMRSIFRLASRGLPTKATPGQA